MSNTEFFCAYSRATSRCIVILDAHNVKKGKYENLGKVLYLEKKEQIESEASKSLIQTLIESQPATEITPQNDIFFMAWSETRHAYILPVQKCEPTRLLLEAFFIHSHTPNIYTWAPDSRNTIILIGAEKNTHPQHLELKHCEICSELTPHTIGILTTSTCNACVNIDNERNPNFEHEITETINIFTMREKYPTEVIKSLPSQIYAIGALHKSRYKTTQNELTTAFAQLSLEGRVAMALVIRELTIGYKNNQTEFKVGEVSKKKHAWNIGLEVFSPPQWQGFINDAFVKLENNGIVSKGSKGIRTIQREKFTTR